MPRATMALSGALWSEFPELRGCRDAGGIQRKMYKMIPVMLDKGFSLPACDLPNIDARIDRAVADARRGAMRPQDSEGASASEGSTISTSHDDSDK